MIKIRSNCFETNSSSTHALCLDTTCKFPKYTKEHLEAFTDVVYPFSPEEASKFNDPHVFVDLKDKIRYFWTIFVEGYFGNTDWEQDQFMCKLQSCVPQASFAYKFPLYREHVWVRENAAYMEDANYVLDGEEDSVTRWSVDELKEFLLNGIIVFGDRDNYDYILHDSKIELFIKDNNLKVLEDYTG